MRLLRWCRRCAGYMCSEAPRGSMEFRPPWPRWLARVMPQACM